MDKKHLFFLLSLILMLMPACTPEEAVTTDETIPDDTLSLPDPQLAWSASTFEAIIGVSSDFPTLTNTNHLSISYSSSDTAVATIDKAGAVALVGTGSCFITASFEGNDQYRAAADSYLLIVKSSEDDSSLTIVFDSAGDSSSEDDISNTTFTRLITVTYASDGASVTGYSAVADMMEVSVSGSHVTIDYTGSENVVYKLTGSSSDGCFKLYSGKKQALWLSDLSLTNTDGAAINNQSKKRTFVYVDGSNSLADGPSATYSSDGDEDMKGVFFSEGQLVFSGSGSLKVTANNAKSKSGIVSDDYVRLMSRPTVAVSAGSGAGHGIKANDYVQISDGILGISTAAAMKKGITSDDYVLVEGGQTSIKVSGGVAYDSDDSEYTGTAGIKADNYFAMTGGTLGITNIGSGGKGLRAGSYDYYTANSNSLDNSYISGGTLTIATTGNESNDVSSKAIKIGFKEKVSNSYKYAGDFQMKGGSVIVDCSKSEAFETKGALSISDGELFVSSTADDAINSQGEMTITGGYVYGYATQNDAIDTNGDMKISGGYVYAITTKGAPEVALDANTEGGYKLYITGGVVVAYGGLENSYSSSSTVYTLSGTADAWNALYDGKAFIAAFKAPAGLSSFAVTAPSLTSGYKNVSVGGTTYCNDTWAVSGLTGGTAVSLDAYSGSSQGGGPGGDPGGNPGGGGGGRH
ncbi:MAG: carbohydrate-binding domain-containing protein [Bacteroidales bacterium]|nr:carbohydrate-binding domain-containing protein [Bacteroidales bacterium]